MNKPTPDTAAIGKDTVRWMTPLVAADAVTWATSQGWHVQQGTATLVIGVVLTFGLRWLEARFPKRMRRALICIKQVRNIKGAP